jgi:hypothetical protein
MTEETKTPSASAVSDPRAVLVIGKGAHFSGVYVVPKLVFEEKVRKLYDAYRKAYNSYVPKKREQLALEIEELMEELSVSLDGVDEVQSSEYSYTPALQIVEIVQFY